MEDKNYKTALNLLIQNLSDINRPPDCVKHHQLILTLGPTPQSLIDIGMPNLPISINGRVIDKCHFDHGISKSMLERMYSMICTPKAIYQASNGQPGCVVMSFDVKGSDPIIIPIKPNMQVAGRKDFYNVVTSCYAKANNPEIRWRAQGLLIWSS